MLSLFYRSDGFHSTLTIAVSSPLPAHTLQVTFSQLCPFLSIPQYQPLPAQLGHLWPILMNDSLSVPFPRYFGGHIVNIFPISLISLMLVKLFYQTCF